MKRTLLVIFIVFSVLTIPVNAQSVVSDPIQEPIVPFRLFKTTNIWSFIQLETATGRMWIIQYDTKDDNRGGILLNDVNLAIDKEFISGRFTLYSTSNMWTFILLDQIEGNTWQVQWSFDKENRFIIPIYQYSN